MFNLAAVVSFLALSTFAPTAYALPSPGLSRHGHRDVPAQFQERGYAQDADLLEGYPAYHERYVLFKCDKKHGTPFWNSCCHPLLKHEPEDALPDSCFEDLPCDPSTTTNSQPQPPSTPSTTHTKPSHTPKPPTNPGSTPTNPPYEPPSTTSTSHQHTTTSESGGGGGGGDGAWHGDAYGTYFLQEGRAGACGVVHSDNDLIFAIGLAYYGDTGVKSPYCCGKTMEIVNLDNGKSVKAKCADACATCEPRNSIDLSVATFKALESNLGVGQLNVKWEVVS